jgi:hypothetical protein
MRAKELDFSLDDGRGGWWTRDSWSKSVSAEPSYSERGSASTVLFADAFLLC